MIDSVDMLIIMRVISQGIDNDKTNIMLVGLVSLHTVIPPRKVHISPIQRQCEGIVMPCVPCRVCVQLWTGAVGSRVTVGTGRRGDLVG